MDLYAGNTYWNTTEPAKFRFEKLKKSTEADVLIIGAGMSGTLCAYILACNGFKVTVVEKGKIGNGSSAANTGLLQYSSDKRISESIKDLGEEQGVLFYKMCLEAMDNLTQIINQLEGETDYRLRDSIHYASKKRDKKNLLKDFEYLKKYGFPAEFLEGNPLRERYNIHKSAALRTWHDAEVNPFKLIQALTQKNSRLGVQYYEDTEINIERIMDDKAFVAGGFEISYKKIILTTGYTHIYPDVKDKCVANRTYAFCSTPMKQALWKDKVMIWETHVPYLYFRTTKDNRIIAGGLDEEKDVVEYDEKKIMKKAKKIAKEVEKIFPHLHIDIEYAWSALFYGSKDGMPFIGRDPHSANRYYLLGYAGNGTCYSVAGAFILSDMMSGKTNPYIELLKVNR